MSGSKYKDYHPPGYWTEFRQRCIAEGRCYKCKRKLFRWGLCREHARRNEESRYKRMKKIAAKKRAAGELRVHRCRRCGKVGHNVRTCREKKRR